MKKPICSHKDCKKKLSLVETQIGICRCKMMFCSKHKLPEQHDCNFKFKLDKDEFIEKNKCIASKQISII